MSNNLLLIVNAKASHVSHRPVAMSCSVLCFLRLRSELHQLKSLPTADTNLLLFRKSQWKGQG